MYRSMLYVPASNEAFVAKASKRGADAIILDLEDGVAPSAKHEARIRLSESVPRCAADGGDVWVRVNRPLRLAVPDVEAAVRAGARGILLTKAESAEHVRLTVELAHDVEREIGRTSPLQIIAMIEHPAALARVHEIASADRRVIGLLTGGEDFATSIGATPNSETLRLPKLLVHMAAKSAGRFSFGLLGTVATYQDHDLIRRLAAEARRHGFDGATCVHPSVVPLLNDAFTPSPAELDEARRMIAEFEEHLREGRGAFTFNGQMVDEPVVERARRLLKRFGTHGNGGDAPNSV